MFKLILLLAVAIVAVSAAPAPAPVPPLLTHPLVYSQPYVKVLPLQAPTLPLSYYNSYKWYNPGSVYLY